MNRVKKRNRCLLKVAIICLLFIVLFQMKSIKFYDPIRKPLIVSDPLLKTYLSGIYRLVPSNLHKFLKPWNSTNSTPFIGNSLSISEIKENINNYNLKQMVLNNDVYGPLTNGSIVIVVQTHNRLKYLRFLIISLAQASFISHALLIFSHDFYDEEINNIIQSIDFCKVMQIFYPYSIQINPYKFPGKHPNDCPRDIGILKALKKQCNNALMPDSHGHYREANFTQAKHHWWWKANTVFNKLKITKNFTGLVVFLEEDHYVAEDFIYMLKLMEKQCHHQRCNVLSLGVYLTIKNYSKNTQKVLLTSWQSNMGIAFNRTTWKKILNCTEYFCKYDDYNWDWSLRNIFQNCLKLRLHALVIVSTRVFHIGECGVHHKNPNCDSMLSILNVLKHVQTLKSLFYPKHIVITKYIGKKDKKRIPYGGWGDFRDHNLCLNMTFS